MKVKPSSISRIDYRKLGISCKTMRRLEIGTPLQLLRHWRSADGRDWIQVQVASHPAFPGGSDRQRGWIHG